MRMRKLARRFTTAFLALVCGALALPGCDRDDPVPALQPTPPSNNTPAPAATAPSAPPTTTAASQAPSFETFRDVTGPVQPDKVTAKVIQTLAVFNHPASCAVSLDGRSLFVTNSASTLNGLEYNKGSISKLQIDPDGRLKMVKADFVQGLHAPMGIAILPKATARFPAGALFVSTGLTAAVDDKGQHLDDITRFNTGVSVFDPATGKPLGFIPMGDKHAVAKLMRHAVLAPAGLCFDPLGNLYVADTGNTGRDLVPSVIGWPGVFRLANAYLDAFAQDQVPPDADIPYVPVRHLPAAVFYSQADDALYWTTCDGQPGAGGAVFRLPRNNFPQQNMVSIVAGDLGALMGLVITPNGSLIASRLDGDLALLTKKILAQVSFYEHASFSSPADIKMLTLPNGHNILYVPEQDPTADTPNTQRLRVILLPSGI